MPDSRVKRGAVSSADAAARRMGKALVCGLTICLKTSKLYGPGHAQLISAVRDFAGNIREVLQAWDGCQLGRTEDNLYLNGVRIRSDFASSQSFDFLTQVLKDLDVGEISFSTGLGVEELASFIELLGIYRTNSTDRWTLLEDGLEKASLRHVQIGRHGRRFGEGSPNGEDIDGRLLTMGLYFKTISHMDEVVRAVREGRPIPVKRLKHLVQALVDLTWTSENLLLSLVNVKNYGEPGSNHAVNVAILSVALGVKLGLSKKLLGDLGISAMLHDVGKFRMPDHLRAAWATDVPDEDQDFYLAHPVEGISLLLSDTMGDSLSRSANVAYMHHYRYDRTGFPRLLLPKEQNLFTRIVAIADFYENATTAHPSGRVALDAEAAFRQLLDGAGTEFDPLFAKAFVNLMGLYPVGCMVRLDTGEVATVKAPPTNPSFLDRPVVKLIADPGGAEVTYDLLERDENGEFLRSILKLYQREEVHLELEEYLTVL
ncbi:MAG TPA: HD domain-containing phosphohydrolase [Planctomycetota bacterium]|nr:HD domain-containing phosphohydrolase [Planctomycetota bacterium]